MSSNNTVLLTGATGFLGSHLLKGLINSKEYKIIILKRSFSDTWRIKDIINKDVIVYDIDNYPIEKIFEQNKIDIIVHTATEYGRTDNSCSSVLETNLMFPIKLAETAINYNVKCFINTDSYFNKENMAYSFLLNYSLSKKSLLMWLKYFSNRIQVVNLILEHIYGEFDSNHKFVENMIQKIAIQKVNKVDLTYGSQKRDFIYISDVVDAYLKVIKYSIENEFRYKIFDIGTGESTSIRNLTERIKTFSNSNTLLNFGAIPYRDDEIMCSLADIIEMKNLEWTPKISIDEGIKRIIQVYTNKENIYP